METFAYVLVLFLFGDAGPATFVAPFETLQACERKALEMRPKIAENNSEADSDKIALYALACLPVQEAPKGKEI